jgi:predicted permease
MKFFEMWRGLGVYFVSVIKLIISPFIALVLLVAVRFFLGNYITESVILAILVATSVSTAASAPLMAKKYQANAEYAATLTLANTIICVITLPLMYLVYCVVF